MFYFILYARLTNFTTSFIHEIIVCYKKYLERGPNMKRCDGSFKEQAVCFVTEQGKIQLQSNSIQTSPKVAAEICIIS